MSDEQLILIDRPAEHVARITLNRPDSLNSLGGRVIPLLGQFLDEAERDRAVRAVVLTGAGRGFCAGGDVRGMQSRNDGQSAATSSADADPVVLEPIEEITVTIPESYAGAVMGDISASRGRVTGMETADRGDTVVIAQAPLAEGATR